MRKRVAYFILTLSLIIGFNALISKNDSLKSTNIGIKSKQEQISTLNILNNSHLKFIADTGTGSRGLMKQKTSKKVKT